MSNIQTRARHRFERKIVWTKGISGSGKSEQARLLMEANPGQFIKISKDHLRAVNPGLSEGKIIALRDQKIKAALDLGHSAIVEDSNLDPKHEQRFKEIAAEHSVGLECINLTDVPLSLAQARNWEREERLPPQAIAGAYKKYIRGDMEGNPDA